MGTGVMIGAGIFALTGQVAELAGGLFPIAFLAASIVVAFSAYSYVKVCNAHPSAGGIAMILERAYGKGVVTAGCALLMYFSMVINESLVARTFGAYTLRIFDIGPESWLVPTLGVGLIVGAFIVNLLGNQVIGGLSKLAAVVKILGVAAFAGIGLWVSGFSFESVTATPSETSPTSFVAAIALSILAYKGFTTITNSGDEIVEPKKNVGRSIIISLAVCTALYMLVAIAVGGNLSLEKIIAARDSALAEAAEPALGKWGEWLTIALAIIATISGIIASMFAVSRMLAMLTEMKLVPHSHFGMPGRIQKHTLVYAVVLAMALTIFFDLSRIASLGAIFYIVMDMAIHWGVFRHLRRELGARASVLLMALIADAIVLGAFLYVKTISDPLVVAVSVVGMAIIFGSEWWFIRRQESHD
jgi:amino acid transporter